MKPSFLRRLMAALSLVAASTASVYSQQTPKTPAEAVAQKHFTFQAQTALPQRGSAKTLSFGYSLTLHGDSLQADLPYFGRSQGGGVYDGSNGPISFQTTQFQYESKEAKKGGCDLTLTPKGVSNVRSITLNISTSGYATLSVTSNQRDAISFRGTVEP